MRTRRLSVGSLTDGKDCRESGYLVAEVGVSSIRQRAELWLFPIALSIIDLDRVTPSSLRLSLKEGRRRAAMRVPARLGSCRDAYILYPRRMRHMSEISVVRVTIGMTSAGVFARERATRRRKSYYPMAFRRDTGACVTTVMNGGSFRSGVRSSHCMNDRSWGCRS